MTAPRVPALAIDEELKRKLLFTLLALVWFIRPLFRNGKSGGTP